MISPYVCRLRGRSLVPDAAPTAFSWMEKNPKKVPFEKEPKVRLDLPKLGGLPLQSV